MRNGSAVHTVFRKPADLEIPLEQVGRYLGLGRSAPDERLSLLMKKAREEFQKAAGYAVCWREVPVRATQAGTDFGVFTARGKNLAKNLKGCDRAILFAATAGMETERQRKRAFVTSPALALVLDAVGTAAIEQFCDLLCREWAENEPGQAFRPRFSPGYGDLPLETQKPLLETLHASQNIGVSLTGALLMIPQKSVSAVVGIGKTGCTAPTPDCSECNRKDCPFRL